MLRYQKKGTRCILSLSGNKFSNNVLKSMTQHSIVTQRHDSGYDLSEPAVRT